MNHWVAIPKNYMNELNDSQIKVKSENGNYFINLQAVDCPNDCSCSCVSFLKYCVCKHLVAYCIINNLNLVDGRYLKKKKYFDQK